MINKQSKSEFGEILIVDDEISLLKTLDRLLTDRGYKVRCVPSSERALYVARSVPLGLILLDITLKGSEHDGFQIAEMLKNDSHTRHIPIIFLSGDKKGVDDKITGFKYGGVDYIVKPVNSGELLARIDTHLRLARAIRQLNELSQVLCHDLANIFMPMELYLRRLEKLCPEDTENVKGLRTIANRGVGVIRAFSQRSQETGQHQLPMSIQPHNLREMLGECQQMMDPKLRAKSVTLNLAKVPTELSVQVDRTFFIMSVINNLLTNAIKFSGEKSMIDVTATREGNTVTLAIRDHGVGMPEEIRTRLFDDIAHLKHRPGTLGESGTGHGMVQVRKFVTAFGGTVDVWSTEKSASPQDHGTEVKLVLRAAE